MVYIVEIDGIGIKFIVLDYIIIDCKVGKVIDKFIIVFNYIKSFLIFKVRFFFFF